MKKTTIIAAALFGVISAGAAADGMRTIFLEEFDRYGDSIPVFDESASTSEYPPSEKSLNFNPKSNATLRKEMFKIPQGEQTANYDISFKVRFPANSERKLELILFTGDDQRATPPMSVIIDEKGSYFAHTNNSMIPGFRLTKNDADLVPFPNNLWHEILLQVRGNDMILYVERDGVMVQEASAESLGLPLTGFNFAAGTPFQMDSIRVRSGNAPIREFYAEGRKNVVTFDKNSRYEFKLPADKNDASFALKLNSYPSLARVKFHKADDQEEIFQFTSFASSYDKQVYRSVTEMKDGKPVAVQKFVKEKTILPDAGYKISGPEKFNLEFYTRPRLQWRYEDDGARRVVSNWEKFPAASESFIEFDLMKRDGVYQLWLDGKYAASFSADSKVDSIIFELPAGAILADMKTVEAPAPAAVSSASVSKYPGLQVPLDISKSKRNREILWKLSASDLPPAAAAAYGVNFIVAPSYAALDLGVCRENLGSFMLECDGYLQRSAFDGMPESLHFRVPTAQYVKAYAICAVPEDADRVPEITARLTKFRPGDGRAQAVCDATMLLPAKAGDPLPKDVIKIGDLKASSGNIPVYLVTFYFDAGNVQDVLVDEKNPFLDFEFVGKKYNKDNYYFSKTEKPDAETLSSVQVLAATLEKSPVEFSTKQGRVTNVYYPDEKPFMTVDAKAAAPGEYFLDWSVKDIHGKVLDKGTEKFNFAKAGDAKTFALNFKQKTYGWYGVDFTLRDSSSAIMAQTASFSLLAPDKRKAGYESPYFVWNFGGAHGTPSDIELIGDILQRMGVRRTLLGKYSEKDVEKWKLTVGQYTYFRPQGNTPEEREANAAQKIKEFREKYPNCNTAIIFHESGGGPIPLELIDGVTEISEQQKKSDESRTADALFLAEMWRKYAPGVRLVIGNSAESIGLLAQLFREKFPAKYIDAMGEESVGMTIPPERSVGYANWQLRKLADIYGYNNVAVEACYEWKSRVIRHLGPKKQAAFRTRDALIGFAWKQELVPVVGISEMANSYYNSIWGDGAFTRYPLLNPHPIFTATAVLTQILDKVEFTRMIPTGSKTVYALEFKRGNEFVYAFWTARGELSAAIALDGDASYTVVGTYGEETSAKGREINMAIGEEPVYLVSNKTVKSVSVPMKRVYPAEQYAGSEKAKVAVPMDDAALWNIVEGKDPRIEQPHLNPLFLSAKRAGKFTLTNVKDEEKGACLELELVREGDCPELVQEYTMLRLKEPVAVEGNLSTIGIWVKGDSGWGKIYWEFIDADGERWISAGTGGYGCNTYDWPDQAGINFDGWHFLQFPVTGESPVKVFAPGENEWQWQHDGAGDRKITFPIKITGVGVSLARKALNLTTMEDVAGKIRLKDISTY